MPTLHAYERWSSDRQTDGDSGARQRSNYDLFAERFKLKTAGARRYEDHGCSGYKAGQQDQLEQALADAEAGKLAKGDVLFVEHLDRLSRRGIEETQALLYRLFAAGLSIGCRYPSEELFTRKPKDELTQAIKIAIYAHQAHSYSQLLSGRVAGAWQRRREKLLTGEVKVLPAPCPSWIEKKDGAYVLHATHAATVRHVFRRTIEGFGASAICKELNESFPPMGKSKAYNKTFVRMLVRDKATLGEYRPHFMETDEETGEERRVPIEGEPLKIYPPCVTEEVWQEANASMDRRTTKRGRSGEFVNIVQGLVYSAQDSCPMHVYSVQKKMADGSKVIVRRLKSYAAVRSQPNACTHTVHLESFEFGALMTAAVYAGSVAKHADTKQAKAADTLAKAEADLAKLRRSYASLQTQLDNAEPEEQADILNARRNQRKRMEELEAKVRTLRGEVNDRSSEGLTAIRNDRVDAWSPEWRVRMHDALRKSVERIDLVTIKLGEQRRDTIVAYVEVKLVHGYINTFFLYGSEYFRGERGLQESRLGKGMTAKLAKWLPAEVETLQDRDTFHPPGDSYGYLPLNLPHPFVAETSDA